MSTDKQPNVAPPGSCANTINSPFEEEGEFTHEAGDEEGTPKKRKTPSQAKQLVDLASDIDLFHTPDREAYGSADVDGRRETYSLRQSRDFGLLLRHRYYSATGNTPASQAVADALCQLEAKALFDSPEAPVNLRVAGDDETIYVDLCDGTGRAVKITAEGWATVADPPVYFRRPKGIAALPAPEPGGSLGQLQELLNLGDERQFRLLVAWLLAAMRPRGPYPVLDLQGGQGASKSTTAKMIRSLGDPYRPPLRRLPRNERDLAISARNQHILAYDNISEVHEWASDAMCSIATGGGMATRQLCTDSEEVLFDASRPIILNGINAITTRPDLADRSLLITLPDIQPAKRRAEKELWEKFHELQPGMLGALYDALSHAMRNLPLVQLSSVPRMADFALLGTAAENGLGWSAGSFLEMYLSNRVELIEESLDEDAVAQTLMTVLKKQPEHWFVGKASKLLRLMNSEAADPVKYGRKWPKIPNQLSRAIKRLVAPLRELGIEVVFIRTSKKRYLTITTNWSGSKTPPPTADKGDDDDETAGNSSSATVTEQTSSPPKSPGNGEVGVDRDDDDSDDDEDSGGSDHAARRAPRGRRSIWNAAFDGDGDDAGAEGGHQ